MPNLTQPQLKKVWGAIPIPLLNAMRDIPEALGKKASIILAGGFIRDVLYDGAPNDIDLFVQNVEQAAILSDHLKKHLGCDDSDVFLGEIVYRHRWEGPEIQVLFRRPFNRTIDLINSFDFTVCQVAMMCGGPQGVNIDGIGFSGICSAEFMNDAKKKRLRLVDCITRTSLARVVRFYTKGYLPKLDPILDASAGMDWAPDEPECLHDTIGRLTGEHEKMASKLNSEENFMERLRLKAQIKTTELTNGQSGI